jgi:hypothetical protein
MMLSERDFDGKLRERITHADGLMESVGELEGRDRGISLARIGEEISALGALLAEQAAATHRAGGHLSHEDRLGQIARFHADAENLADDLRQAERDLWREERLEEAHIQRVPGLSELGLTAMSRTIVTRVIHALTVVVARHAAAGHGDPLGRIGEWVMKACDAPERLDNARGLKVKLPLPTGGLLQFDFETTLSDEGVRDEEPLLADDAWLADHAQVELAEEDPAAGDFGEFEDATAAGRIPVTAGLGWPVITGWAPRKTSADPSAGDVPPPSTAAAGAGASRPGLPPASGIVIWGSARAIALGTRSRILSPGILLSCARRAAFDKACDATVESVPRAMRAAGRLELVVFLDPDIQGGLWIDVDPVAQVPAATMLIDLPVSPDGVRSFRLLQS